VSVPTGQGFVRIVILATVVLAAGASRAGAKDSLSGDDLVVGIQGRYLTAEEIAELFNIEVAGGGVLVEHVVEDSPAARAGLHGGELQATIQGDPILLGGDLIVRFEVHKVCEGACLLDAPSELTHLGWIGVTYLRKGKLRGTMIDVGEHGMDPVNPDPPIPDMMK
jgi:S1-C subfamily serine protease